MAKGQWQPESLRIGKSSKLGMVELAAVRIGLIQLSNLSQITNNTLVHPPHELSQPLWPSTVCNTTLFSNFYVATSTTFIAP